jgi:Rhodopirellula transposase DDE domain
MLMRANCVFLWMPKRVLRSGHSLVAVAGKSRVPTAAADHDFEALARVTPVGIMLPASNELFVYGITSKVTSDCLVDCLERWWQSVRGRFATIKTLVINLDNGPENHSRRTQFVQRLLNFASDYAIKVRLAYYPPYHSKYNAVERCWGILENHWNGALLDTIEAVMAYAGTMTWKGRRPVVELVTTSYAIGVKLSKEAMKGVEAQLTRHPTLGKWFLDIAPAAPSLQAS